MLTGIVLAATPCLLPAQSPVPPSHGSTGLDPALLLKPTPDSWPLYHGDYSGKRHSHLSQITHENVGKLTLAWAFQTHQAAAIKSSPLLVNGILYFTVPDNIWAVDARSGHMLWHYNKPTSQGHHLGQRGVGVAQTGFGPPPRLGTASAGV